MKFDCVINHGCNSPEFLSAAYGYAVENNCVIGANENYTRLKGVATKKDFQRLMTICDNFNALAIWAYINPRIN